MIDFAEKLAIEMYEASGRFIWSDACNEAKGELLLYATTAILRLRHEGNWSFDISTAPRGRTVKTERQTKDGIRTVESFEPDILLMASSCGKVLRSYWVPATNHHDGYWAGFAQKGGTPPVAWMHWPTHPTIPSRDEKDAAA